MSSSAVSTEATPPSDSGFVKAMTLTDATMLVAGSMIGSGIFIVSAGMARDLPSPLWMILAWVLSGVMTLLAMLIGLAGGRDVLRETPIAALRES